MRPGSESAPQSNGWTHARCALASAALWLIGGGCQSVLGIDDPPELPIGPAGWVFYTTDVGGTIEIWAAPDTGGQPVRITEGMTANSADELFGLTASWDGRRLAVAALRTESGAFDRSRHIWVLDVDGSDPRYVTRAVTDTTIYGLAWEGDSRHIVYAGGEVCANDLRRVDADDPPENPADANVIYASDVSSMQPAPNPTDASDLLFVERPVCNDEMTARRLDLNGPAVSSIPGVHGTHRRYERLRRSADGTRFTYAFQNVLYIHDFAIEVEVYADPDPASAFDAPSFGNADTRLYAKWCSGANECDLVAIDPATGTKRHLGLPNIRPDVETSRSVTWADIDRDIDSNGDGIADGLPASR